jgi:hypothetical protein
MTLTEIEKKIAELESQKKEQLKNEKSKDLAIVRQICKKHGFTAKMLKGYLSQGRNRTSKAA